ncbi:MAG: hypothetical protein JG776_2305 [Caloramator sp.]|jgi:hypothetical protein|uniref:Uncharacterized protein n=1 Tax=Caloramator proteoclasticus DSM 10124 TaxID=1121262 RepID=A0A1M5BBT7_9CLOT|nr:MULTISPECIES: hypothetical protein [Caloramator]MBZ4664581.1 hypothetical protein [Caloramator sp.]MCX7696050.1 hypothetical protein [Caloramator sp.]SHF39979.1 hypothetical protein SAMN02746091_02439 [Caloramator proteoclasticus DSM 10124]
MSEIDILSQIADLKEVDYKNTLMVVGLIELLIEKGLINKSQLIKKIKTLDKIADIETDDII